MTRVLRSLCLLLLLAASAAQAYDKDMVLQMLASEASIAGLSQHTMTIDGQKIAYLDNGASSAPRTVVLVHGFGDSSISWNFFARVFRDGGFRIVIPDLLGFGDSARPADADYGYKAQAQRVLTLMKNLNISQAHLVGNSMGGGVVAEMDLLQPQSVSSLTLIDAAGVHYKTTALDRAMLGGSNPLVVHKPEDFEHLMDFVTHERPLVSQPIIDYLADRAIADSALQEHIFRDVLFPDIDFLLLDLPNIQAPTLILWGEADQVLSPANALVFKQYIPHSQLITFPDVGHMPMAEIPEKSAFAVRQFIDSLKPKS